MLRGQGIGGVEKQERSPRRRTIDRAQILVERNGSIDQEDPQQPEKRGHRHPVQQRPQNGLGRSPGRLGKHVHACSSRAKPSAVISSREG